MQPDRAQVHIDSHMADRWEKYALRSVPSINCCRLVGVQKAVPPRGCTLCFRPNLNRYPEGSKITAKERARGIWGRNARLTVTFFHSTRLLGRVSQSNQIRNPSPTPSRRVEELKMGERGLQSRTIEYDNTFREESAHVSALVGGARTRRGALRRTENTLTALAVKLDKLAEDAREEEALRALVPAGSER